MIKQRAVHNNGISTDINVIKKYVFGKLLQDDISLLLHLGDTKLLLSELQKRLSMTRIRSTNSEP